MTGPSFRDLFAWEWRRVGRSPLLWAVLLILSASFVWGSINTASLHNAQEAAMGRALDADAKWHADAAKLAIAFRAPVSEGAGQVAYWQDPTNVAGYSEYFVRKPALKHHLPLSPLAAGVSDLAPSRLEIKLNLPFGFADTYDFENPRGLALGRFDLAFAIVFLMPIGLLLLFALLVTFERDREMLRLIAAQATHPRIWIGARMGAIVAWAAPFLAAALILALAAAGVALSAALPALGAALLLLILYMLFWAGIALIVLARQPGAGAALGSFAALWALLTVGLPLAISALTGILDPPPSAVHYVDSQRRIGDDISKERDALIAKALEAQPDLKADSDRIGSLNHATRLSFLIPETERRLAPLKGAIDNHRDRQERLANWAGYVIPTLGVEIALTRLAGTDPARQRSFEAQARDYQQRLREQVYPLVQAEIAEPPAPEKRPTRGRLNLTQPPVLPEFALVDPPLAGRAGAVLPFVAWLALVALLTGAIGLSRIREWKVVQS